jgi:hypothetical protein
MAGGNANDDCTVQTSRLCVPILPKSRRAWLDWQKLRPKFRRP